MGDSSSGHAHRPENAVEVFKTLLDGSPRKSEKEPRPQIAYDTIREGCDIPHFLNFVKDDEIGRSNPREILAQRFQRDSLEEG